MNDAIANSGVKHLSVLYCHSRCSSLCPLSAGGVCCLSLGKEALAAPRAVFDRLPPYAQRATWAHQNAFEAFMLFAAAALMAYVTGVDQSVAVGAAQYFWWRGCHTRFFIS